MFPEEHKIFFKLRLCIKIVKYYILLPHFFISLFFFEVYNKIDLIYFFNRQVWHIGNLYMQIDIIQVYLRK